MNITKHIAKTARLAFHPPLIQFSPPRTGSTLLWNILRVCLPSVQVVKQHTLTAYQKCFLNRSKIVSSVRNPLDAVASSIQRYDRYPSRKEVEHQIAQFKQNGIWDVLWAKRNSRALVLKYEDFVNDYNFIYDKLELFLGVRILQEHKDYIATEFSIDAVKRKSEKLKKFTNEDKDTHIHGQHISRFQGTVGYYHEYFDKPSVKLIYWHFREIFKEFNYEVPTLHKTRKPTGTK